MLKIVGSLFLLISIQSVHANSSCLKFISKKAKLLWSVNCSEILSDNSVKNVSKVNLCVGEYVLNNRKFSIVNGEVTNSKGQKSAIITSEVNNNQTKDIQYTKITASPELLKRYKHSVNYKNNQKELMIKKSEGLFSLSEHYDLLIICK